MSHFMIRNNPSLLLTHDAVLFLLTDKHYLNCVEQILLADELSAFLYRIDCRLVDHIGKIRADSTACRKCDRIQVNGLIHQYILGMNLQNIDTTL